MRTFKMTLTVLLSVSSWALAQIKGPAATVAPAAKTHLEPKSKSDAHGNVTFTEKTDGLEVNYDISGLKKNSSFGFHIHEKGDCSAADAKSAGSHYIDVAPQGGTSLQTPHHFAGDLPSLKSNDKGVAKGTFMVTGLTINKTNPIEGHALVLHGGPDDVTKNSPPRIACGVIESTPQIEDVQR